MAATYNKKKGSAAVQSLVTAGASVDQRKARRSLTSVVLPRRVFMDRNLLGKGRLVTML